MEGARHDLDLENLAIAVQILEESPSIALRVVGDSGQWKTVFITRNVARLGYNRDDFISGRIAWQDIIHPEDLAGLTAAIEGHQNRKATSYNNVYRILSAEGKELWISDHSTDVYDDAGNLLHSDCIISDYTETRQRLERIEDFYRQQRVLKEILLCLRDVDTDGAFNTILDSTGVYLDVSRVILFEDDADHKKVRSVFEWCNSGIPSMGELVIDYQKELREIDEDLRSQGYSLVSYGDIPPNSRGEFDKEGVIAAAIFAVYIEQERYGFICFDECVKHRVWPEDTVRFLQNIADLVTPFALRKKSEEPRKKRTDA